MSRPLEIPDPVRRKAFAAGASGWLGGLPDLVEQLERDWRISVGRAYEGGTEAFVADAVTQDGRPCVLKVVVPRPGDDVENEITVLRLAGGRGCAALLAADQSRQAILVERLGPSLFELERPLAERLEILTATAVALWRPVPDAPLPTGADQGRWLADHIAREWEALDRPCSERAVAHALTCLERRIKAHDDERSVLVHGDVHQWNALRTLDGNGFKLVDPNGLRAEPEYDLGVLMREDPVELITGDPRRRSRRLAARTGLDETAIWEWGVSERVSTGLVLTRIELQPVAGQMLAAADRIAAAEAL